MANVKRHPVIALFIQEHPKYDKKRRIPPALFRRWLNAPSQHCEYCGKEVMPPKVCWCGPECREAFHDLLDDRLKAKAVRERDDYKCVLCGDPGYEVDHIIPVAAGGGNCDTSNLRTLCNPCHKKATSQLWEIVRTGRPYE